MSTILQFAIATLLPACASGVLYALDRRSKLSERMPRQWQAGVGIVFGLIAVLGTEMGIKLDGATMNVRDAAPLAAGLIFGAPAGIIAGVIGGVERWLAALWGRGMFTRIACSVSTVLAGLYAAGLRVKAFDNRKPTWLFGVAIGVVMEVLHLTMIFVTNIQDATRAFRVVMTCSVPMISCNALSVGLSLLVVALIAHEQVHRKGEQRDIAQTIQSGMLVVVAGAFIITTGLSALLQSNLSHETTRALLTLNIDDVRKDIEYASDANLLALTRRAAQRVPTTSMASDELLGELKDSLNVSEISVIDATDTIIASTEESNVGFSMMSGIQASSFMTALKRNGNEFVQSYQPRTRGDNVWRKYAGVSISGGYLQVGLDAALFQDNLKTAVKNATANRHVGESGYLLVADAQGNMESQVTGISNLLLGDTPLQSALDRSEPDTVFSTTFLHERLYGMYEEVEGYRIVALLPAEEADFQRGVTTLVGSYTEVMVLGLLFAAIYYLIKTVVVDSIKRTNARLAEITHGNLEAKVDVRSSREFASLSDDINSTVDTLKTYIDEAAARIDKELQYARNIQLSALPSVFPPYPNRTEFEIYASMNAAKEVGGDFYDFYLLDEDHLAFLVADVSGKGIPASLFMMRAKTVLKSYADTGMPVEQILANANSQLAQDNDTNMFVTTLMGIIDLNTGRITASNAGHNPPALKRADEQGFQLLTLHRNLILGFMEDMPYTVDQLDLDPGDVLFLYTDGVVEANDEQEELFGDERMLASLDRHAGSSMQQLCEGLFADVNSFVGTAPQFDDITMLALRYRGPAEGEEMVIPAEIARIDEAIEFINDHLDADGCTHHARTQVDVALDELLANVCSYAYRGAEGIVSVRYRLLEDSRQARITVKDEGVAFNPLLADEPDITLGLEERGIGGLGIFIVRRTMDDMTYERREGCNVVTIYKSIDA